MNIEALKIIQWEESTKQSNKQWDIETITMRQWNNATLRLETWKQWDSEHRHQCDNETLKQLELRRYDNETMKR